MVLYAAVCDAAVSNVSFGYSFVGDAIAIAQRALGILQPIAGTSSDTQ